jgi:hypothetical protein
MTPEANAREKIDHKLAQVGWRAQDFRQINPGAPLCIAVREPPIKKRFKVCFWARLGVLNCY